MSRSAHSEVKFRKPHRSLLSIWILRLARRMTVWGCAGHGASIIATGLSAKQGAIEFRVDTFSFLGGRFVEAVLEAALHQFITLAFSCLGRTSFCFPFSLHDLNVRPQFLGFCRRCEQRRFGASGEPQEASKKPTHLKTPKIPHNFLLRTR